MRALPRVPNSGALLSCFGVLMACITAHANDATPKPAIEIATESVHITVTIDPALEVHPALIADILAEARATAAETVAEAEAEAKSAAGAGDYGPRWEFETSFGLHSVTANRYVDVLVHDYGFMGGAHGSSDSSAFLWDLSLERRTDPSSFFVETAEGGPTMTALTRLVRGAVVIEKLARDTAELGASAIEGPPSLDDLVGHDRSLEHLEGRLDGKLKAASLEPSDQPGKSSGLAFHFHQCEVEPCANGGLEAFVSWREFAPFLTAQGASLFGGERPRAIEESD